MIFYYKMRQILLQNETAILFYKMPQKFIAKYVLSFSLQIVIVIPKRVEFVAFDSY